MKPTAGILGFTDPIGKKIYTTDVNDPKQTDILQHHWSGKEFQFRIIETKYQPTLFLVGLQ
jgi:hypothetical protein